MLEIKLESKAKRFIDSLPPKHQKQVKNKVMSLQNNPIPHDAKKLLGYENCTRVDVGEYRIIYEYEEEKKLITVILIGRRNDSAVYKIARRIL